MVLSLAFYLRSFFCSYSNFIPHFLDHSNKSLPLITISLFLLRKSLYPQIKMIFYAQEHVFYIFIISNICSFVKRKKTPTFIN